MDKLEKQEKKIKKDVIKGYEMLKDEIEDEVEDIKENISDNYLEMKRRLDKMFSVNNKKDNE